MVGDSIDLFSSFHLSIYIEVVDVNTLYKYY